MLINHENVGGIPTDGRRLGLGWAAAAAEDLLAGGAVRGAEERELQLRAGRGPAAPFAVQGAENVTVQWVFEDTLGSLQPLC